MTDSERIDLLRHALAAMLDYYPGARSRPAFPGGDPKEADILRGARNVLLHTDPKRDGGE